jgi:hypothetical protein
MSISKTEMSAAYAATSSLPNSTQIAHDCLSMHSNLDHIARQLATEGERAIELMPLADRMTHVIEIYNEDVITINSTVFKELKKVTENVKNNVSTERTNASYADISNYYKEKFEIQLLRQMASVLQKDLSTKISETCSLLLARSNKNNQLLSFSPLNTLNPETCPTLFEPVLRQSHAAKARSNAQVEKARAFAATHCDVTINIELNTESTLGFCCAPDWGNKPTAFKKHAIIAGQWDGNVPRCNEWKFVIIQDGQVVKWEQGNNRLCDANAPAQSLTLNSMTF